MKRAESITISYIKQFGVIPLTLVAYLCVFLGVLNLYGFPKEPALYAAALCAAPTLIFTGVRYRIYKAHVMRIRSAANAQDAALSLSAEPCALPEKLLIDMIQSRESEIAAQADRARSEQQQMMDYYTTWVHQIKTPIAAMNMLLQGEDTELSKTLSDQLFQIEQYAALALNYQRLTGGSDMVIRQCSLDAIIRRSIHRYAPMFIHKRLRLNYGGTDYTVLTDEKWLQFMIEQLISNAIKYTTHGGVDITVRDGVLTVSDTGMGIDAADLPRIFERGYTGLNGRLNMKSTGIGLYMCRLTADRLNHMLSVTSTLGEGSAFSIDLRQTELEPE